MYIIFVLYPNCLGFKNVTFFVLMNIGCKKDHTRLCWVWSLSYQCVAYYLLNAAMRSSIDLILLSASAFFFRSNSTT